MSDRGVVFRPARREEVAQIARMLADDVLGQTRENADLDIYLSAFDAMANESGNTLMVGVDAEGRVVATYQLTMISGLSLGGARRAQIEAVRVAAHLRGQGVGAALLADAEARAKAGGCVLMQLTSNKTRKDALRFYQEAGYAPSHIGFKKSL